MRQIRYTIEIETGDINPPRNALWLLRVLCLEGHIDMSSITSIFFIRRKCHVRYLSYIYNLNIARDITE